LERNVSVRTPESIAFYYELAGLGSRFLAVAIDGVIQTLGVVAVLLLFAWAAPGAAAIGRALGMRDTTIEAVQAAITIILIFLAFFGYFVAFETLWNGQTPGKRIIGIRVVRDGGYPVAFMDSVIRNLVRIIEALLGYIPSIVSALASSQNKRLGDLAAGTIVVRDRAFEVTDASAWMSGDEPAEAVPHIPGFERISDDELALAERYVSRSHMLDPRAAHETAKRIADAVRPKLGPENAEYSDHDLLVRIAAARRR
jgi:uncharacterized RDD family membrane protein YckC